MTPEKKALVLRFLVPLAVAGLLLFVLASLLTHTAGDPPRGKPEIISNVGGTVGAYMSHGLLAFAGVVLPERVTWLALPFDRDALKTEYGVPWYPVIDRTLCTGCGTCRDYCLFSVFASDGAKQGSGRVSVTAPLNCKTGCPACARLCPEGALIFPFCHEAELNGEVEHPVHRSADALAAALGDDPMRMLAERRKQKQRLIDPSRFEQAEKDRITYSGVL